MTPPTNDNPQKMPTTNWSLIGKAGAEGETQRRALTAFITQYSPALRAILMRRFSLRRADAEDALQGFLTDRVLEKDLIARADRKLGKFRTFLLTSLEHYVIDQHRKQKRRGGVNARLDTSVRESAAKGADPQQINDTEWAKRVMQLGLTKMKQACGENERMDLWIVFEGRLVAPSLEGAQPRDYVAMMPETGFKSPMEAMNALATAKRMFQRVLTGVVREYIEDPDDAQEEIASLLKALAGGK